MELKFTADDAAQLHHEDFLKLVGCINSHWFQDHPPETLIINSITGNWCVEGFMITFSVVRCLPIAGCYDTYNFNDLEHMVTGRK